MRNVRETERGVLDALEIDNSSSREVNIKTSGSESRGQEEAACMRVLGLCDHYSKLFTRMEALKF